MIYFIIFIFKFIENTLSTFRLIVVSKGKKLNGAILQGIVTLVWAISVGLTIIDFKNDYFKIFVFCLGASIGSYFGSYLEEKIRKCIFLSGYTFPYYFSLCFTFRPFSFWLRRP